MGILGENITIMFKFFPCDLDSSGPFWNV